MGRSLAAGGGSGEAGCGGKTEGVRGARFLCAGELLGGPVGYPGGLLVLLLLLRRYGCRCTAGCRALQLQSALAAAQQSSGRHKRRLRGGQRQ